MSRKLMMVLLSSALAFGNMSTSAWSATDVSGPIDARPVQSADAIKNQAPLPPAGAAGIKQAQGFAEENSTLLIVAIGAALVALWILLDDDDDNDNAVSTTGT